MNQTVMSGQMGFDSSGKLVNGGAPNNANKKPGLKGSIDQDDGPGE